MTTTKSKTETSVSEEPSIQKRNRRFERWLEAPGVTFAGSDAETAYRQRVSRFIKALSLEEADRVPYLLPSSNFPAFHAGMNLKTVMYDYSALHQAWCKFMDDFEMDAFSAPGLVHPAKVFDLLDYKLQLWPGHGLDDNAASYQYVEGEYMKDTDYDALINEPLDFLVRTWLPRTVGAFAGLGKLDPLPLLEYLPVAYLARFADSQVRQAVLALLDAGQEAAQWLDAVIGISREALRRGLPSFIGGRSRAPFDFIGDSLRGTRGVMLDMYKRPEKLLAAMDRVTPIIIDRTVKACEHALSPVVIFTLHKGPAGFMSNQQFETFYWPSLRRVMMGLINEGLVPMPFAEGDYTPRLEIIADMPRASTLWHFETMDMTRAKAVVGKQNSFCGNLPASILYTGTPQQVEDKCRELIRVCAPGGGYILTGGAAIDSGDPDNLRAIGRAVETYGQYPLHN